MVKAAEDTGSTAMKIVWNIIVEENFADGIKAVDEESSSSAAYYEDLQYEEYYLLGIQHS